MDMLIPLDKLKKDVRKAAATLSDEEARYLLDTFYQIQQYRIMTGNQLAAMNKGSEEPHETLSFFFDNFQKLEKEIRSCLEVYVKSKEIGKWLLSICGIGPIIAAGLIAHINIRKVQTAGQIQAFAGLDPTKEWKKGEKRPFNASLKVICWKAGESFVKVSGNKKDIYGHIYKERKDYEIRKNEALEYKDQAEEKLKKCKIGKNTEAYKYYSAGKLPPAHIQARSTRYAVKIFLSHLFSVWYEMEHGEKPPKPYAISILGHAHEIAVPNWKDGKIAV